MIEFLKSERSIIKELLPLHQIIFAILNYANTIKFENNLFSILKSEEKIMGKNSIFIGLHHGSVIVQELDEALKFYCEIIGLKQNLQRPEMKFSGAWLDVGAQQIHLLKLPETEQSINQPDHAGRDRHLAIHVTQIETIIMNLENEQIPYTMSRSGRQALFCRDPDGNGLEFIKVETQH